MKWLVLGANGMFGSDMFFLLDSLGEDVTAFTRADIDLESSQEEIEKAITGFDVIVNAVAYTNVALAETETEKAYSLNAELPGKLALITGLSGQKLVHISSDYVFDGLSMEYATKDKPNPINVYGKSKALGERAVLAADPRAYVVRTSWLYGVHGKSFPRKIAEKLLQGTPVEVVADQIGAPVWTRDLAEYVVLLIDTGSPPGIYHGVSRGATSWFEFARVIAHSLKVDDSMVVAKPFGVAVEGEVKRPPNSILEPTEIDGQYIEHWKLRFSKFKEEFLPSLGIEPSSES